MENVRKYCLFWREFDDFCFALKGQPTIARRFKAGRESEIIGS
jgi:hypothetical protein